MNDNSGPRFTQLPAEQFNDVQKRVAELWQREQSEKKWTEFLAVLRSKATIRIDLQRYPELGNAELAKRSQANR